MFYKKDFSLNIKEKDNRPEFRKYPIPGTRHKKHYHYARKLGKIGKIVKTTDFKKYGRKQQYEDIIDDVVWCEYPYRHVDRSWKSSYKCRHQWQKHLK